MLDAPINNHHASACAPDRTNMSTSYLPPGTNPLRIQKGSSRSPSPVKDLSLPPVSGPGAAHTPTPYTLKPRKPSNASSHQEGARRTSSSYSSLRSNSLVSNSPFKGANGAEPVGPRHRPAPSGFNVYRNGPPPASARSSLHISMSSSGYDSQDSDTRPLALNGPRPQSSKIPTPSSRTSAGSGHHGMALVPIASDSDAPSNAAKTGYKRRQSRGLQSLPESERVTKSPFVTRLSSDRQDTASPSSGTEWETETSVGPESSPEIGARSSLAISETDELPELPTPAIDPQAVEAEEDAVPPPPPPKPPLHARLAAISARASTPPRAQPSTSPRSLSIDTSPMASPVAGTSSPTTPTSAYKTPMSSQSTPVRNAEPSTPTPSTPTSPGKSPRRSANAPSPTRSSLVSKRLLGPRSSPSPRASIPSPGMDSPNTSGVSRTSSGRLVVRKGSGVNRKNSRVKRKSSGGRYVPLNRRGSTKNGRKRKTVTFDERCDVLEFDAGVGIDGEAWSEGDWSDQEHQEGWVNEEGKGTNDNESPDVSVDDGTGRRRYASPPMVPSGSWNQPTAWGSSPAMSTSGSGSMSASGSGGSMAQSSSTNSMNSSAPGPGRYTNLGHGSPHEELETYGFGRQATAAMSTPTRIGMGAPGFTPGRPGARNGTSAGAGRAAGGVFGESARDSFGRTGRGGSRGSHGSSSKDIDGQKASDSPKARDSTSSLPTRSSATGVSAIDMFDQAYPLEAPGTPDLRAYGSSRTKLHVVNGSPGSTSGPDTSQIEDQEQRDAAYEQHADGLSEVQVQHSEVGVIVHHSGGAGVVVHHSGTGMVQGVYMRRAGTDGATSNGNVSMEGVSVHHSGHSAVQVYDEQSPDLSAGDISLGGAGLSFASLMSFDSIISRGDASRLKAEEEEGEESFVGGRLLDGLDAEEVVIKEEEEEIQLGSSPTPNSSLIGALLNGELADQESRDDIKPSAIAHSGSTLFASSSLPGIPVVSPLMGGSSLPPSNTPSRSNSAAQPLARPIEPKHTGGSMSGRSPRISRDEVLRRLKNRQSGSESPNAYNRAGSSTPTPMDKAESPAQEETRPARGPRMSGSRLEIERLMAGVEQGFADASGEGDNLGFNPADESHTSLPYRRKELPEEPAQEPEPEEPKPQLEPQPEIEPELTPTLAPASAPAPSRIPKPSATNSATSAETETEVEEAITPPIARTLIPGPATGLRFQLAPELSQLDPGRPSSFMDEFPSRPSSFLSTSSAGSGLRREPSGKERIKAHEERILAKRRELRGGPSRPKSKSFADPLPRIPDKPELLEIPVDDSELALEESFNEHVNKIYHKSEARSYFLREAHHTIYVDDKVKHNRRAGDIDGGKAWRTVRRPSDMNEYSRQIKELRAQAGSTKAHGKVFVKVRGLQRLCVPIPPQPTYFTCTLNNGIHFVTTPECRLEPNAAIDQEFELIEHGKLEFTLTIKVRKDTHIVSQLNQMHAPPPPAPVQAPPPPKHSGFRGLFSSTPKKQPKQALLRRPESFVEDHLVRYMKGDGSLGRAYINFKDIAKRCDTRLFETSYPLIGEWAEDSVRGAGGIPGPAMTGGPISQRPVGELVLQIFRLPPLPGVPPETLPQSLEECHRGLRAVAWHKKVYHQGVLTQNGGDVTTWRRRQLRVIGSNLVAYNDITGRAIATIDLKRALAVEDDQQPLPPNAIPGRRSRDESDLVVERSFRLIFGNDDDIAFFADTDEEKAEWLRILRALVGNIPPHPLWAELVWQRHEQAAAAQAQQAQPGEQHPGFDEGSAGQAPSPPTKSAVPQPRPQAWR